MVDKSFAEVPRPDVVVFPGGIGTRVTDQGPGSVGLAARGPQTHDLHHIGVHRWPGAGRGRTVPLASWGYPHTGLTATTHWRAQELFNSLGATYVPQRVVEHSPASGRCSQPARHHHRGWGVQRHRHGIAAGRVARRSRSGRGQPIDDRIRPETAVRLRRPVQGIRGHPPTRLGVLQTSGVAR